MVLTAALFSTSAVKNGLLDEAFIYAFTRFGLQLPASETFENEMKEVAAIGAVLLLAVCSWRSTLRPIVWPIS